MATNHPNQCCPRCGYDLSGAVDSWTEQCPVEGVCSECGLEFRWRNILNPEYRSDPLFYETATLRLRRAARVTYLRALRPWSFWRWVKLEYTCNPARMIFCIITCGFVVWLLGSVGFLAANAATFYVHGPRSIRLYGAWIGSMKDVVTFTLWPDVSPYGGPTLFAVLSVGFALWMSLMPLTFAILGETLARAKVRWVHVVRVGVYQFAILPFYWLLSLLGSHLEYWLRAFGRAAQVRRPNSSFLIEVVLPLSGMLVLCCITAAPVVWIVIWWGTASKRYLRIRHPWLVATVMAFTSGLAVVTAWMYYALTVRIY